MSTYRNWCPDCDCSYETEAWEPDQCPLCELVAMKAQVDELLAALIHIQQVACSGSPELGIATDAIANAEAQS